MISVSNLSKSYGDRALFAGASFQLNRGERYGLVGANGSGKTTLLEILGGDLAPSDGTVSIPRTVRLGMLRQDQFLYEHEQILDVALRGNRELWQAIVDRERLLAEPDEHFDADRFADLEETVQRHDGYTAEARAAAILEGLGIAAAVHREPLSTLSGGFKLRVLLAQVLASSPDALLLDEPTNHLDILAIRWLEKFLHDFPGPVVVISHDQRFLDNVCTKILDVDYGTIGHYTGNYTAFVEAKRDERERRESEVAARQKEIADHQKFVDRFRAKASKARQAQSKLRLIEKKADELEVLPSSSRRYPTFRFVPKRSSGREVLRVRGIRKAFGDNEVLHGVDLRVRRGDRLIILGPNGIGKSTLLKIIMGELEADEGEIEWGTAAQASYFAQDHHEQLDHGDGTVEDWLWSFCPGEGRGFVRAQLGLMLFSGDEGEKRVSSLSGGEAARLVFSRLTLERPNVLVLDEPTNHLDLESIDALVAGLQEYDGTLILVSHDRWFVRQLATRVVEISATAIRDYPGTYEEYVHACGDDHLDLDTMALAARRAEKSSARNGQRTGRSARKAKPASGAGSRSGASAGGTPAASARPSARRKQLTGRRDEIVAEIEAAEGRIAAIDKAFCEPGFYEGGPTDETLALEGERTNLQARIDRLMHEWETVEREIGA